MGSWGLSELVGGCWVLLHPLLLWASPSGCRDGAGGGAGAGRAAASTGFLKQPFRYGWSFFIYLFIFFTFFLLKLPSCADLLELLR